jgi:DNA-binding PadR family transcriptional regulator
VLTALLSAPDSWRHGYELAKATNLQSGTLYPILMRLAEQGFLDEDWQPSDTRGRPPRHVYRLSGAGVTAAREAIADRVRPAFRIAKAPGR